MIFARSRYDGPRPRLDGIKSAQDCPVIVPRPPQDRIRTSQDRPKTAPRRVRTASRRAQGGSRWAQTVPRQPQNQPKTAPEACTHKHAPRNMYRIQAIPIPGLGDARQSWSTSYLSTEACKAVIRECTLHNTQ